EGYGVYVRGGASGQINACTINANEQDSVGVSAYGCSNITVGGATVVINANGQNGHAIEASHGSSVTILDGVTISATGDNGIGVDIGLGGDGFISGGTIAAEYRGVNVVGEDVYAQATISGGTITVTGTEGIGINAQSTGFLDENGNNIQDEGERDCVVRFSGGTVLAAGEESTGLVAFGIGKAEMSGPATINATGLKSTCVYASNGGYIKISAGTITASGDKSTAISIHLGGLVEIVSSIVSITGSGSYDVCIYSEDSIGTAYIIMPDMKLSVYLEGVGAKAKIADNTITALEGKTVIVGTAFEKLNLPTTVSDCSITWAPGSYDGNTPGEYVIYGHLTNPINVQNTDISLGIKIIVTCSSPISGTMEILPAAEGYEFHMRNVSDTTPSQYYGLVYQSGSPYTGSSGQVTVNFAKSVYDSDYEYVSVPIISERFPVGNYEMNIYSDAALTTEVGSVGFTINPMVHITQPGLHDSTNNKDRGGMSLAPPVL
ncbi:MAG: hypothetical protein WA125_16270, partial [Desulfosporosinus sp.]